MESQQVVSAKAGPTDRRLVFYAAMGAMPIAQMGPQKQVGELHSRPARAAVSQFENRAWSEADGKARILPVAVKLQGLPRMSHMQTGKCRRRV